MLDVERGGASGVEVGEGVVEEGLDLVGGDGVVAMDFEGGGVVGADRGGGAGEGAVGVDDCAARSGQGLVALDGSAGSRRAAPA